MIEGKLRLTTVEGAGRQFVAHSGTGHALVMDDADGHSAPKPIELALLALGGCTAFDVIGILRKKRQKVTGYEIELRMDLYSDFTCPHCKVLHEQTLPKIMADYVTPGKAYLV